MSDDFEIRPDGPQPEDWSAKTWDFSDEAPERYAWLLTEGRILATSESAGHLRLADQAGLSAEQNLAAPHGLFRLEKKTLLYTRYNDAESDESVQRGFRQWLNSGGLDDLRPESD